VSYLSIKFSNKSMQFTFRVFDFCRYFLDGKGGGTGGFGFFSGGEKSPSKQTPVKKSPSIKVQTKKIVSKKVTPKKSPSLKVEGKKVATKGKPKKSPSLKVAPKKNSPPPGVPKMAKWRKNRDGSVTGFISGSRNFDEGEKITTSPIVKGDIANGSLVQTGSGSKYFLV